MCQRVPATGLLYAQKQPRRRHNLPTKDILPKRSCGQLTLPLFDNMDLERLLHSEILLKGNQLFAGEGAQEEAGI